MDQALPEGYITLGEIDNYKTQGFYHYYGIWENYHFFGLPHGKGWVNEPQWLIEFLKEFEKAYNTFQNHEMKKATKK